MNSMFEGCSSLESLSLNKFKTNKVQIMSRMFKDCSGLKNLEINNFDTTKVIEMDEMFSNVINLRQLNLSSFNTRNLYSWTGIWNNITELNIIIDVDKNQNILENIPDGINITDINEYEYYLKLLFN